MSVSFSAKARCSSLRPPISTVIQVKPSPSASGRYISSKRTGNCSLQDLPQEIFLKCVAYLSFSDLVALEKVSKFCKKNVLSFSILNPFVQEMQFFVGITKELGGIVLLPINSGEFSGRDSHAKSLETLQAEYVQKLPRAKMAQRVVQQAPHKKYEDPITEFTEIKREMVQVLVQRLKNQQFGLKNHQEALFFILRQFCYLIVSCKEDCLTFGLRPEFSKIIEKHFGHIVMTPPVAVASPSKGCCIIC